MTQEEVLPPTHRLYEDGATRCRLCFSVDDEDARSCRLFPDREHRPSTDDHHPPRPGTTHTNPRRPAVELLEMILECTSIRITLEEDYPAKVCEKCVETLDKFYQYRRRCLLNDQILRTERQAAALVASGGTGTCDDADDAADHKNNGPTERTAAGQQQRQRSPQRRPPSSSSACTTVPVVVRIKSEPAPESPPVDRLEEDEAARRLEHTQGEQHHHDRSEEGNSSALRIDPQHQHQEQPNHAVDNDGGGPASILRSILLQTRDSATSRSSPNTEPESPRQTPQPPSATTPNQPAGCSPPLGGGPPVDDGTRPHPPPSEEPSDVKPSLLQQMLLQQVSPARSPSSKAGGHSGGSLSGGLEGTGSREPPTGGSSTSTSSTASSLLKRMLLDGGGSNTSTSGGAGEQLLPHRRPTKHEPPSATGTPSPPAYAPEEKVPSTIETTPLASQLRSILLQHRAAAMVRSESMSSLHQHQQTVKQQQEEDALLVPPPLPLPSIFEKPEVSYVRSLFLRNDSDSDGEPPATEDQRELLLYTMFQELRARQQEQQQHHHHAAGFSSDSDDSDDAPQDYRLPSVVRRRSTESIDSRTSGSSKRRRMEYPCLLCGRTFAGRTKLIMHMRTHMMPPAAAGAATSPHGSSLPPTTAPPPGSMLGPVALANGGATLANSDGDLEDTSASHSSLAASMAAAASAAAAAAAAGAARGAASTTYNHNASSGSNHPTADGGASLGGNEDEIDALERRSYACYICGADQNNLHQLKEHLLAAHQDRIRSRGRTRERQRTSIGCEICHRQFRSQFAYGEHMRTHTGERPFPCDQCDKRFPRRFQLLGHLFNVHKQSWVADESKAKFAKK